MLARLKEPFEALRGENGAFIAALHKDYHTCYLRDHLYATFAYFFLEEHDKFRQGMWLTFDIFHKHRQRIKRIIEHPPKNGHEFLHAKYDPETLGEIEPFFGHHQLDALGLFLFIVGFAEQNGLPLVRKNADKAMLNLLVLYVRAVEYCKRGDNGMWQGEMALHSSSVGAVLSGLVELKAAKLVKVRNPLIANGITALDALVLEEPPGLAQLSLIWPYDIVTPAVRNEILSKVSKKLVEKHGLNRYFGDEYYRSRATGISAQWPLGFFWLSIIKSELGDTKDARLWFERGAAQITPAGIPKLYTDDTPNDHVPLAWAHALAIIAYTKLQNKAAPKDNNHSEDATS
ncbi:MAG: hypothetical protein HY455_03015 [Parcubacteria group bacterium]|nr:hypothetical protein [Parcubacteria group bacterium]